MAQSNIIESTPGDPPRQIDDSELYDEPSSMTPIQLPPVAAAQFDDEEVPPEFIVSPAVQLPSEEPPAFYSEAVSLADESRDTLPDYSRRPDPNAPRLPSYARATRRDSRNATIEELLPTEEERLASLRAFAEEKMYVNDYWGGHKGSAEGMPNDPFKVFKWAKRKMSGERGSVWRRLSDEQKAKWEAAGGTVDENRGEVAWGDIDTHTVA